MVGFNWYTGHDRSMLLPNCFFRMGCSAVMLSNHRHDHPRAKYNLEHIVRTYKGGNDASFRSVYQEEDEQRFRGLRVSKDVVEISGDAIKTNITTLGESGGTTKPYIPDFKLAFEHFCVHAASKTAVKEVQRNLRLSDANMEASWDTLQRFGNTSSNSIWYELAYLEAKVKIKNNNEDDDGDGGRNLLEFLQDMKFGDGGDEMKFVDGGCNNPTRIIEQN
ncbi:hypothetical protein L6452_03383 [Arctium lappa]|uniref:Uncharacterized protein n=1 Tax=Arctium lappa TaxID=4217 RepID=A0ACB9FLZ7_ARCLA|nr:hypothetical protein L6452_03383 [Arctium lappa]